MGTEQKQPAYYGNRYPWGKWFSKNRFTLRRGVDYYCLSSSLGRMMRVKAQANNLRISVKEGADMVEVVVISRNE